MKPLLNDADKIAIRKYCLEMALGRIDLSQVKTVDKDKADLREIKKAEMYYQYIVGGEIPKSGD